MRTPWNKPTAAERLSQLAQTGDLLSAMNLLLSGLEPLERARIARELLPHLPGSMAALALSESMTGQDWASMRDSLTAAEKRPAQLQALISHGRGHHEIDLSLIPAGSEVDWQTAVLGSMIYHPRITLPDTVKYPATHVIMAATGDGSFELNTSLFVPHGDRDDYSGTNFETHSNVVLGGIQKTRNGQEFSPVVRHGRPLYAVIDQRPVPIEQRDRNGMIRECYLANVALDGQQVFVAK